MKQNKTMDIVSVSEKLGLRDVPAAWKDAWNLSMDSLSDGDLFFLESDYLADANKILLLEDDTLEALQSAAIAIRNDPCLCALVWHCRCLMIKAQENMEPLSFYIPSLGQYNIIISDLFFAIVLISSLESVVLLHKARGIQKQVTYDTFGDFRLWMNHFYQTNGRWGLGENEWLTRHFTGRLYRFGRLQFAFGNLGDDISVFRNKKNANVIAFYREGVRFRRDNQLDGTNGIIDHEGGWMSYYKTEGNYIIGKPISPYGRAVDNILSFKKDEWKLALSKGDSILEIHIPAGGSLTHDLCKDSFKMAMEIFDKCFPERNFSAFTCNTWLLEPKFQELLPFSNIVNFQREFYIYPLLGSDKQTFERVFGKKPDDLNNAPRDTSIRRAILDYYLEGGRLSNMGGFILKDDLNWGSETYQKGWGEINDNSISK